MNYDSWKTRSPEDDGPAPEPCPVCSGDEDAEPCTEDCARVVARVRAEREIDGYVFAIVQVLKMARAYRREHRAPDPRVAACLAKSRDYRAKIRALREVA